MNDNLSKTTPFKYPRKIRTSKVRIVPIFRKEIDIQKLGKAILDLALRLNEVNSANVKDSSDEPTTLINSEPGNGGSYE